MKIIDKHITGNFFYIFPSMVIGIVSMICIIAYVIDVFVVERYIPSDVAVYHLFYYYLMNTIASFNILIPFLSFLSTAFLVLRMSSRNEIIAVFCAGISYKRFTKIFFITAVFLMKVMLICESWIIPEVNKIRERLDYEYFGVGSTKSGRNIHLKLSNGKIMYISYFDKYTSKGTNVFIDDIVGIKLISRLKAEQIKWDDKKNVWIFYKWENREFGENSDKITKGDKIEVWDIDIIPDDLIFDTEFQTKLNMDELNEVCKRLKKHGVDNKLFKIEQVKRVVRPLLLILVMLIGVFFYSDKKRTSNKTSIAIGFILACSVIISSIVSEDIAMYTTRNVYVLFFTPLLLFSILCFLIYRRKYKLL